MLGAMDRRTLLLSFAGWPSLARAQAAPAAAAIEPRSALRFPADYGAHPDTRTEWWYLTGTLQADTRLWGFQLTFFRAATGIRAAQSSRFNASQIIVAHAALTDLRQGRLRHDQRIARQGFGIAQARVGDTGITLRDWRMERAAQPGNPQRSRYSVRVASDGAGLSFELQADTTQPVLLQGDGGVSCARSWNPQLGRACSRGGVRRGSG